MNQATIKTLDGILARHPFFSGLDSRYLQLAVGCAANVRFNEGDLIFKEGKQADNFYLIRQGQVPLELIWPGRGSLTVQTVGEGEVLGWSWLIPPYHWRFDARAMKPTLAIVLDGKCLRAKCEEDHQLGYELVKRITTILGQRLDATRVQLLDLLRY